MSIINYILGAEIVNIPSADKADVTLFKSIGLGSWKFLVKSLFSVEPFSFFSISPDTDSLDDPTAFTDKLPLTKSFTSNTI